MKIEAIRDVIQTGIEYEKETQQFLSLLKKQPELAKKVVQDINLESIESDSDTQKNQSYDCHLDTTGVLSPTGESFTLDISLLLKSLLIRYVTQVPDILTDMLSASDRIGFRLQVEAALSFCETYFLNKPLNRERPKGVQNLLMDAYVAHHLVDEVNAHFVMRMGLPLILLDMTEANQIVQRLIPYTLVTKLDSLVASKVDKCLTEPMPDLLAS